MPLSTKVDRSARIVFTVAEGIVTSDDLAALQRALGSDPDFTPDFAQLCDLQMATKLAMNYAEMNAMVHRSPFGKGSKRAYVAPRAGVFGVTRMAQALFNEELGEVRVYREMAPARRWLGLD